MDICLGNVMIRTSMDDRWMIADLITVPISNNLPLRDKQGYVSELIFKNDIVAKQTY